MDKSGGEMGDKLSEFLEEGHRRLVREDDAADVVEAALKGAEEHGIEDVGRFLMGSFNATINGYRYRFKAEEISEVPRHRMIGRANDG